MGQSELALRPILPILGFSVLSIRGNDTPFNLHRIDIEIVIVRNRCKPDVLASVLPIGPRAAPFLTLPSDAVPNNNMAIQNSMYGGG